MEVTHSYGSGAAQLSDPEIEAIRHNDWSIDCPQMALKGRGNRPLPTVSGRGSIFVDTAGQLRFKLYSIRQLPHRFDPMNSFTTGAVIPDSGYYDLRAIDLKGRPWAAQRILPQGWQQASSGRVVAEGPLWEVSTAGILPRNATASGFSVRMISFQHMRIPYNKGTTTTLRVAGARRQRGFQRNVWTLREGGVDFRFVQRVPGIFSIAASASQKPLPTPRFPESVAEALQFLAGPFAWRVRTVCEGRELRTAVRSNRQVNPRTRLQPPLLQLWIPKEGSRRSSTAHHRNLFRRYLRHVQDAPREHALSGYLDAVYEGSGSGFIDSYALTLTVAIEALLLSEFPDTGRPRQNEIEAVDVLLGQLDEWKSDLAGQKGSTKATVIRIIDRAKGAVSQIKKTRVGDRLRALEEEGAIARELREAWEKLRNVSTHELHRGASGEKLRVLLPKVEALFYHLIFHAIGYRGLYTDYSSEGWPLRDYPPTQR